MKMENPRAARRDGQTSAVVSEAQNPQTETSGEQSDEALRRLAVARLAEQLDIGASLAARCEHLAELPKGDRLGAIYAAARLMRANAFVAQSLAIVGQVERRRRSIVERIQPPDPKTVELNARLQKEKMTSEQRLKIWNRMNEHIEQSIRARTGETQERDSVAELIKSEEEELARTRQQCDDAGLA